MQSLTGAAIGAVAGLIVSSWQGFKDPPWEGFSVSKFLRSIGVGIEPGFSYACSVNPPHVIWAFSPLLWSLSSG